MGCIDVCVQNCMNIPINLSLCFSVSLEDTVSLRAESINLRMNHEKCNCLDDFDRLVYNERYRRRYRLSLFLFHK